VAVAQALGRRSALIVKRHDAHRNEPGIKAIAKRISASRSQNQPDAVDVFTAVERNSTQEKSRGESHY
jgi:hypothetical protein